jgi:ferritin-like protein
VANTPVSPLDSTGRAAAEATKKNAKILKDRKDEISIAAQVEAESLEKDVFDPKHPEAPLVLDEIETIGVSVNNERVIVRTITDIEDMTFGVGNHYTFKAGVKYSVPKELAAYLEQLGYIWRPN